MWVACVRLLQLSVTDSTHEAELRTMLDNWTRVLETTLSRYPELLFFSVRQLQGLTAALRTCTEAMAAGVADPLTGAWWHLLWKACVSHAVTVIACMIMRQTMPSK